MYKFINCIKNNMCILALIGSKCILLVYYYYYFVINILKRKRYVIKNVFTITIRYTLVSIIILIK